MNELLFLNFKLLTLSVFKNVLKDSAIKALLGVFAYSSKSLSESLIYYSNFLKILFESEFEGDFTKYLNDLIKHDENVFTKNVARGAILNENIANAAKCELAVLSELFLLDTNLALFANTVSVIGKID